VVPELLETEDGARSANSWELEDGAAVVLTLGSWKMGRPGGTTAPRPAARTGCFLIAGADRTRGAYQSTC
jgi:hypothetical protein